MRRPLGQQERRKRKREAAPRLRLHRRRVCDREVEREEEDDCRAAIRLMNEEDDPTSSQPANPSTKYRSGNPLVGLGWCEGQRVAREVT
jgi:hypothetical protein